MPSRYGLLLILIGLFLAGADYASPSEQCVSGSRYSGNYCPTGYFILGSALATLGVVIVFGRKVVSGLRKLFDEGKSSN